MWTPISTPTETRVRRPALDRRAHRSPDSSDNAPAEQLPATQVLSESVVQAVNDAMRYACRGEYTPAMKIAETLSLDLRKAVVQAIDVASVSE